MNDDSKAILRDALINVLRPIVAEAAARAVAQWRQENPAIVEVWEGNAKPSKCCRGEGLVPLHSTNTKMCLGCKTEYPWPLEPGQVPTFRKELKQ